MDVITRHLPTFSHKIEAPVFVVGCCNSGTSILWRSLLSHPDFSGPETEGQDLRDLPSCMRHFLGRQTFRMFAHPRFKGAYHLTEHDYDRKVADRLISVYTEHHKQGTRLIEKSPANSMRTRFIQSVFPDATFVIIVRNGVAVSEGIRRKRLYDPDRQQMAGLVTTIADAAQQWYHANQILLQNRAHLRKSILVKYEDMVAHPANVLHSILQFCGCDSTDTEIPVFDTNHNEKQAVRLTPREKGAIHTLAGSLLADLGYDDSSATGSMNLLP